MQAAAEEFREEVVRRTPVRRWQRVVEDEESVEGPSGVEEGLEGSVSREEEGEGEGQEEEKAEDGEEGGSDAGVWGARDRDARSSGVGTGTGTGTRTGTGTGTGRGAGAVTGVGSGGKGTSTGRGRMLDVEDEREDASGHTSSDTRSRQSVDEGSFERVGERRDEGVDVGRDKAQKGATGCSDELRRDGEQLEGAFQGGLPGAVAELQSGVIDSRDLGGVPGKDSSLRIVGEGKNGEISAQKEGEGVNGGGGDENTEDLMDLFF